MPLVLRRSSGETAPVYAIHLDGDSSPGGHRYSLCPELFAATRLDIFCGQTVLPMRPDDRCSLVDGTHEMEALVIESFDLRDHALIRCHPIKVA